jgi:hypothetical protein
MCCSVCHPQNAGLISRVVVVGVSGVDNQYLGDNLSQLPFFSACSRPMRVRYFKGATPKRALFTFLYYAKGTARKGGEGLGDLSTGATAGEEDDDDDDDDDADDGRTASAEGGGAGGRGAAVTGPAPSEAEAGDPLERLVLSRSQLELWGFPVPTEAPALPPTSSWGEGEGEDLGCPIGQDDATPPAADPAWLQQDQHGQRPVT